VNPSQFDGLIEEIDVRVQPGDICLLTTDGVNERRNAELVEITFEPVMDMIRDHSDRSSSQIIRKTLSLLDRHGDNTDQHDDITIVAIVFTDRVTSTEYARTEKIVGESA